MEIDRPEGENAERQHFNGAVPIKRARMDLTTTGPDAALMRRQREANKQYGRGKKIPRKIYPDGWSATRLIANSTGH